MIGIEQPSSVLRACGDDPDLLVEPIYVRKVFSAHAGMILAWGSFPTFLMGVPRACGDEPKLIVVAGRLVKCSLRMWG